MANQMVFLPQKDPFSVNSLIIPVSCSSQNLFGFSSQQTHAIKFTEFYSGKFRHDMQPRIHFVLYPCKIIVFKEMLFLLLCFFGIMHYMPGTGIPSVSFTRGASSFDHREYVSNAKSWSVQNIYTESLLTVHRDLNSSKPSIIRS